MRIQGDVDPAKTSSMSRGKNVLGTELELCCSAPTTGFFRDGYCRTDERDRGLHVVCAVMTHDFLAFSHSRGNDLITPIPVFDFPGLKPEDTWCLCATRWREAYAAGVAPKVDLVATHQKVLEHITLEALKTHAINPK